MNRWHAPTSNDNELKHGKSVEIIISDQGSQDVVEMTYAEIQEEFEKMLNKEKELYNRLKDYLGTFTCEEKVQMIVAYRNGGNARDVLELLEDGSMSILSTINRMGGDRASADLGSAEGYYEYRIGYSSVSKDLKDVKMKQTIEEVNENL